MKVIRIGVIGAGIMGERHCRVCANLPRVELVGVADPNEGRGRLVASRYGITYFSDLWALLPLLDCVTVAAPTSDHHILTSECLEAGLHVMVEKPITETVEQGRQLVHEADGRGLVLQVGHIERFNPAFTELKHVTEGMSLVGISMRRLSPFVTSNVDVDVVRDLMIHDLDLAVDIVGLDIEAVNAWGRSINTDAIDHAVAHLSFRGGPIVTLFASRVAEQKVRAIEVVAEGIYAEADLLNKSVSIHRGIFSQYRDDHDIIKYRQESVIERIHVPMFEPLMLELRHFTDCVRKGQRCRVSGSDGLRALQLAEAVANEIARGRLGRECS